MRFSIASAWVLFILALANSFPVEGHSIYNNNQIVIASQAKPEGPISSLSYLYAKRSLINFEVCGGGPLLSAAIDAAESWKVHLAPRISITISQSGCSSTARFRNGTSEIYFGNPGALVPHAAAIYQGLISSTTGTLGEEDILVDSEISDQVYLANILTHELGHALGLDHARGSLCSISVMSEYACSGYRTPPTEADIAAAKLIYKLTESGVERLDLDRDGFFDDREFFQALDLWLSESLSDRIFFDVVDLWIGQKRISSSTNQKFRLQDADNIMLFDLSGKFLMKLSGAALTREMKKLPHGIFIYRAFQNSVWLVGLLLFDVR